MGARERKKLVERLIKAVNILMMALVFALVWRGLYDEVLRFEVTMQTKVLLLFVCLSVYVIAGRVYEAFLLGVDRVRQMVYSQMLACVVTDCISFIILWMVLGEFPSLLILLLLLPLQLFVSIVWSCTANLWYFRHFPPRRALVITRNPEEADRLEVYQGFTKKFNIVGVMTTEKILQMPDAALEGIEAVFLLRTENAWAVMQRCALHGIRIYRVPLISEIIASCSKTVTMFNTPMLRMDGYNPGPFYVAMKRLMDIFLVGIVMPVVAPVMLAVAIAIKLDDGGPVFYRQERLTQGGRHFNILKFRSMRVNAESDGVARMSTGVNDDRITRVGHIIRALRLDELPQLLNILKGDMSIVGPRPERPELAEEYTRSIPEFRLRLLAKAGLTGYAQVYGKYNTTPLDKLRMDLMYILRPSIIEDLRIMFATVKILFMAESTEGIAEGQTNAMVDSPKQDGDGKTVNGI